MLDSFFYKIGSVIVAGLVSLASLVNPVAYSPEHPQQNAGAIIPTAVADFRTSLASSIGANDTSMTLVAFTDSDGNSLTAGRTYGFVIENGTTNKEYVSGVASSSNTIVSMSRGLSVTTGNTSVTALKKAHRRGASVEISDAPILLVTSRILNGDETIPNVLTYASSVTSSTINGNSQYLASKAYVDGVAFAGAPDASESAKGLFEAATQAELAAGTATGTTGALLAPQGKWFNATSSATTTVPVTNSSGKLSSGFIDQTANYTWSGTSTFTGTINASGTTNLSTTTVNNIPLNPTFGGTGSDGALNITSGTTTIDLASSSLVVKNYTSISITGTGRLAFTNPHTNGTTIILKSQGNVTITCSSAPCIDASSLGAAGGAGGAGGGANDNSAGYQGGAGASVISDSSEAAQSACNDGTATGATASDGSDGIGAGRNTGGRGGRGCTSGTTTWTTGDLARYSRSFGFNSSTLGYAKFLPLIPGSGGGGGGGGNGSGRTGTAGGRGGGALYIEVGGALNFTTANGLSVAGGAAVTAGSTGRSGSGGGAGACIIQYNTLTAASGTCNVSGGTSAGTNPGYAGAVGLQMIFKNTDF